jgi:hypothetical protein
MKKPARGGLSMVHGQLSRDVGLFLLLGAGAGITAEPADTGKA